jgi:hypothetical protein
MKGIPERKVVSQRFNKQYRFTRCGERSESFPEMEMLVWKIMERLQII